MALIKKKKLIKKTAIHDDDEIKKAVLDNLKSNKQISFASNKDIEDSLDALYQDYSEISEAKLPSQSSQHVLSEEEIEEQAHDLIEAKADELFKQFQADVRKKREQAEAEIEQMLEDAKANAENQAVHIIGEAQAQADELKEELEIEKEALEADKAEFENAIEAEKQKAYEEGMAKADAQINEFVNILTGFNRTKAEIIDEVRPQIVAIATSIAEQILGYEADNNPNLIEEQVTRAVSRLVNTKGVMQIYLNPEDERHADYLNDVLSRLLDSSVRLIFLKDEEVDKGSCMINTQGGRLDSRFSTQLELIKVAFERYLGHKIDEIDNLNEELDISGEPSFEDPFEDEEMAKRIINPNSKKQASAEPSDEDLELLESDPESLIDLDMDEDLDALLQDVMLDEDEEEKSRHHEESEARRGDLPAQSKKKEAEIKVDHDDSTDLGANDFANGDDIDLDAELSISSNSDDDEDVELEEYDEFADDDNLGDDSNFDGSQLDDRFPEY